MSEEKQTSFVFLLAFVLLAGCIFTYFVFQDKYHHPSPEEDCSEPYDYPMCVRAQTPAIASPPSSAELYVGVIITALLALFLIIFAYKASVTSQANLVVSSSSSSSSSQQRSSSSPIQSSSPSAGHQTSSQVAPAPIEETQQSRQPSNATPPAIPRNVISPEKIVRTNEKVVPPEEKPAKGVNLSEVQHE